MNRREIVWVAVVSAVALTAIGTLVAPGRMLGIPPNSDAIFYLDMARHGLFGDRGPSPMRQRILLPLIVRLLPFDPQIGFHIVTSVCLFLSMFALYYVVRLFGSPTRYCKASVLLVLTHFYPTVNVLMNPGMVESLSLLLWTVSVILIVRERLLLLTALIAVSVLAKEDAFFLAPACFYLWFGKHTAVQSAKRVAAVFFPAVLVYLVSRQMFAAMALRSHATEQFAFVLEGFNNPRGVASGLLLSGGTVWIVGMLGGRRAPPPARRAFWAGVVSAIPLTILTLAACGRKLIFFTPFWLPLALNTWLPDHSTLKCQRATIGALIIGNLTSDLATVVRFSMPMEWALRVCAVGLQLLPLLIFLRLRSKIA